MMVTQANEYLNQVQPMDAAAILEAAGEMPLFINYTDMNEWYSDLTNWFISVGMSVKGMEVPEKRSTPEPKPTAWVDADGRLQFKPDAQEPHIAAFIAGSLMVEHYVSFDLGDNEDAQNMTSMTRLIASCLYHLKHKEGNFPALPFAW